MGEEAGSRETCITDVKKTKMEAGGAGRGRVGMGHPGVGVNGITLGYNG